MTQTRHINVAIFIAKWLNNVESNKFLFHPISYLHIFNMHHHSHKIVVLWSNLKGNEQQQLLKKMLWLCFATFWRKKLASRSTPKCTLITTKCVRDDIKNNITMVMWVIYMCIMISLYIILFKHISESAGEDKDECLITLLEWEMRDAQLAQMIQVDCNECQKGIKKEERKFLHIHKMLIWMCIKWYPSYGDDLSSFFVHCNASTQTHKTWEIIYTFSGYEYENKGDVVMSIIYAILPLWSQ